MSQKGDKEIRVMKMFAFIPAVLFCLSVNLYAATYGGGNGTASNPYQIATKADLLTLAATTADYGKCFILTADIDLTGEAFMTAVIASDTDDSNYDFDGIEFTGTLDGNAHQIKNLIINGGSNHYIGLLGQTGVDGQIKNLAIVNANIQGNYYVGGLAGENFGVISSCYITGTVSGNGCVGGLAGVNSSGTISFCHAAGSVDGNGDIGGLVGFNYWGILGYYEDTIRFCYAAGEVSGDDSIGGLVGSNHDSTIISCFATGAVNGYSAVGGLVGENETSFMLLDPNETGKVISCYATGSVSGEATVGGLLGANAGGQVIYCYSIGTTTGAFEVGGLVGMSVGFVKHCETICSGPSCVTTCNYEGVPDPSLIEYSFWDTQTSGQATSAGGEGKTTAKMKTLSTFTSAGWDFTSVWGMALGQYPELFIRQAGDLNLDTHVDMSDLMIFAQHWLEGI